jgi:hypothetical protein
MGVGVNVGTGDEMIDRLSMRLPVLSPAGDNMEDKLHPEIIIKAIRRRRNMRK